MKKALALRHVHFEDVGTFGETLAEAGYEVRYSDVGDVDFLNQDPSAPDLLIILGGPIGVYDTFHPFLNSELAFVRTRLSAGLPTLEFASERRSLLPRLERKCFLRASRRSDSLV